MQILGLYTVLSFFSVRGRCVIAKSFHALCSVYVRPLVEDNILLYGPRPVYIMHIRTGRKKIY